MQKDTFPPHTIYRQGRMTRIARLLGKNLIYYTIPGEEKQQRNWTLGQIMLFSLKLETHKDIEPLIRAIDAEHRDTPVDHDEWWDKLIVMTGTEVVEDGKLDWSRLSLEE